MLGTKIRKIKIGNFIKISYWSNFYEVKRITDTDVYLSDSAGDGFTAKYLIAGKDWIVK